MHSASAELPSEEPHGRGANLAARGLGITRRAAVVLVVAAVLMLSYASSLRVYFRQQGQLAQARQSIAQHQQDITSLQQQVQQWNDPTFVTAQARTRLGWVMPGEIGYQVIGPDGKVLSPSVDINASGSATPQATRVWWQQLGRTLRAADQPAAQASTSPATSPTATVPRTITPTTTPTATASSTGH